MLYVAGEYDVAGDLPAANIAAYVCTFSDCDGNGVSDADEIAGGAADTNGNGVPDDCECLGDVNFDSFVNGADISVLLGFWGLNGKPVAADIDQDGQVDGSDLAVLLANWGTCP